MTIRVHIERLVLDGLPINKSLEPEIRAAIELELQRILIRDNLIDRETVGIAGSPGPNFSPPTYPVTSGSLGVSVAQAIQRSIEHETAR